MLDGAFAPILLPGTLPLPFAFGLPTLTKEKRRLKKQGQALALTLGRLNPRSISYRNCPSVRTLRSCKMNQMPILSPGSVRRKALADKLPMRFLVNIPVAAGIGGATAIRLMLESAGL